MTVSKELENTLQRAYELAKSKKHEFITLEHILFEMTNDPSASGILVACGVDMERLKEDLGDFIDNSLKSVNTDDQIDPQYSVGSQYVLRVAAMHVQSAGKEELVSGNLLVAMFREEESHAVYFLKVQGIDAQFTGFILDKPHYFTAHALSPVAGFDKQLIDESISSVVFQTVSQSQNHIPNGLVTVIN